MYVGFSKNFNPADWYNLEIMHTGKFFISLRGTCWRPLGSFLLSERINNLIPAFKTIMDVVFTKNFISPISRLLGSFWPPEPKNTWFHFCRYPVRPVHKKSRFRCFELFRHHERGVQEKSLSRGLQPMTAILGSFKLSGRKNTWFQLFKRHISRLYESCKLEQVNRYWTHFAQVSPKSPKHHVRHVREKFLSRRLQPLNG